MQDLIENMRENGYSLRQDNISIYRSLWLHVIRSSQRNGLKLLWNINDANAAGWTANPTNDGRFASQPLVGFSPTQEVIFYGVAWANDLSAWMDLWGDGQAEPAIGRELSNTLFVVMLPGWDYARLTLYVKFLLSQRWFRMTNGTITSAAMFAQTYI